MKRQQLTNWKKRMQSMNQKAEWLNRKGFSITPTVGDGAGQASCKTEDAEKLWSYWDQFWKKQDWQVEELRSKQDELTDVLKPIVRGACAKSSRPNLVLFKMRIKSVEGCPGADGWSREEIMAVTLQPNWFGTACKSGNNLDSHQLRWHIARWGWSQRRIWGLFGHWKKMKRWIILDSHVCGPASGLPQGDPLSPLVLVVMMHALQVIVETRVGDPKLRHFIYMDDRTAVASSKLVVKETQLA